MLRIAAVFLLTVAAGFSGTSAAQDLTKPILLIATPVLRGPYARSVLIATPKRNGIHMGFILNQESETSMSAAFPDHAPAKQVTEHIFFGGPELNKALFAVIPRKPEGSSFLLFGEVYATNDIKTIDDIIEKTPNDARYFAGFVGWIPGELQNELENGFWYPAPPETAHVFNKNPEGMWEELVKRFGGRLPLPKGMQQSLLIR